jgi:hypothetical protein
MNTMQFDALKDASARYNAGKSESFRCSLRIVYFEKLFPKQVVKYSLGCDKP